MFFIDLDLRESGVNTNPTTSITIEMFAESRFRSSVGSWVRFNVSGDYEEKKEQGRRNYSLPLNVKPGSQKAR